MKDLTMNDEFEVLKKVIYEGLKEILEELKKTNQPKQLLVSPDGKVEELTSAKFPFVIRGNSDKAYLLEKRWVKNPETLQKLGFTLNDIQTIPMADFMRVKEGQPIDLKDEPIVEKPKIVPPPSMSQIFKKKDGNVLRKANKK